MCKLLVVDDDPKFRQLVASGLRERELQVIEAASLAEADVELTCTKYDLVILDGVLGDGDGEEWLRAQRSRGNNSSVVFVSAQWRDTESYYRLVNELQVQLVVHKPVEVRMFVEQVHRLVEHLQPQPPNVNTDLSQDLWLLSVEFVEGLPDRFSALAEAIIDCKAGVRGAFSYAVKMAHQLRGTGASFGQPWVTDVGTQLEEALKRGASSTVPLTQHSFDAMIEFARNAVSHAKTIPTPMQPTSAPAQSTYHPSRAPRVLLVDDDPYFTRRAEQLLGAEGVVVTTFGDTVRILDLIEEVSPQLMVLDLNMPGLSGVDVCRHLRSRLEWKHLPILMVTADTPMAAREMAMYAEATDYETKPIANKHFVEWILSYLEPSAVSLTA
jgi:DNA-binding response OmpR family regulator